MRIVLGIVVAAVTAALAGLIMGEYELRGALPYVAGLLFGLAIAEAAITVGASRSWLLAGPTAVFAFAGLAWAARIDAGDDFGLVAGPRWVGAVIAGAAAAWWIRQLGGRAAGNPRSPEPE